MNKKKVALLAATALCLLSASGIAAAEDKIYYGSGNASNTGDIKGVNWLLDKDYRYNGGHQWFYTAYTLDGNASDNTLTVNGGVYTVSGDTSGSGKYSNYFYGGITENSGSAIRNGIVINNGNFVNESKTWQAAGVYAGKATGNGHVASDNYVTINGGTFQGYTYISPGLGYDGSDAVKNRVEVNGGSFEKGVYIFGGRGYSTGNTDYNTVSVTDGKIGGYRAFIWGGKADNGDARYNTVNLSGGEVASVPSDEGADRNKFTEYEQGDAEFYGGYTLTGDALYNTVNISGGSVSTSGKGLVYGGYSRSGNANYNRLNITGGSVSSKTTLIGGFSANGNASNNIVSVSGGSGNGNVYIHGGITMNSAGNSNGNKVAIYFPAKLKEISGGTYVTGSEAEGFVYNVTNGGDLFTGNELYIGTKGVTADNIFNFEKISFRLPSSYLSSDTMLTLAAGETTDLTRSKFALYAAGDAQITKGQTINLISTNGKLEFSNQTTGKLKRGVSLNYDYTVENNSNNLQAVVGEASATSESKSPVETRAAQAAFLNRGADLLISDGMLQAETAARPENKASKGQWSPFFAMQAGKFRYQTGSHVNSRGFNALLGMAREVKNSGGKLNYGLAVEYGKGSYDSHYDNMRGDGDNNYTGATIFARQKNNAGTYYEGSLRLGRTKADYVSRDFTGYSGESIGYDTASNYFGAHLGLGKIIKLKGKNELDVSFRYFYTRTGGDSARLTTGETYDFSAVNSHRLRLGGKLLHAFTGESKGYFGAYYERELSGDAKASVAGYATPTPSIKGGSGIFEIGLLHQPKNSNFTLNLGATLACGKQRGAMGKLGFMWKF